MPEEQGNADATYCDAAPCVGQYHHAAAIQPIEKRAGWESVKNVDSASRGSD